jgi:hypothetical protein
MGLLDRIFSALGLGKQEPSAAPDDQAASADKTEPKPSQDPEPTASSEPALDQIDPERDLELEAQDDCGSFDFARDIARFFTAEFRIEQAWINPDRREQLFAEYEIRNAAHWGQIKATFERWLESPEGKSKYPNEASLTQARMTTTQTVTIDELERAIEDSRRAKA